MAHRSRLWFATAFVFLLSRAATCSSDSCSLRTHEFVLQQTAGLAGPPQSSHMLFFLHLPRTAGRTYHSCFLKTATPPSRRCEKSYDVLRLNTSIPSCGLLSSHDDISISDYLPADTAFITQLRSPVDRVLSAYEFSVEVAARAAHGKPPPRQDPRATNTRNVWPWSGLVPWLEEELHARAPNVAARALLKGADSVDPWNNTMVLPLHEWIEHPLVHELIHDGQTLQVLGLTNYSTWDHAKELRACSKAGDAALKHELQTLAIERLRHFAHVGVTDMLEESITSLAAILGMRLQGPSWKTTTPGAFKEEKATVDARARLSNVSAEMTELRRKLVEARQAAAASDDSSAGASAEANKLQAHLEELHQEQQQLQHKLASKDSAPKQVKKDSTFLNREPLWRMFRQCEARARAKSISRRHNSLKHMPGLEISAAVRSTIDPRVIGRIRELNSMDEALHAAASEMLSKRFTEQQAAGALEELPQLSKRDLDKILPPHHQRSSLPKPGSLAARTPQPHEEKHNEL